MKGLWAGGLTLALAGWASGGAAELPATAQPTARGVSLGRPTAAPVTRAAPRPDPAIRQASFTSNESTPATPTVNTKVAPRTLPAPRATPLPTMQPYTTSFATENRIFGQPIIIARTGNAPSEPEITPVVAQMGVEKYLTGVRQMFGLNGPVTEFSGDTIPLAPFGEWLPDPYRWYGGAEVLLWRTKGTNLPPLVTTSPNASQGILGQPGTEVLFGGGREAHDERIGGRFTLGWWCDPCQQLGVEATYFFLGQRSDRFFADSNRFPLLARPFFNLNRGTEFSEVTTRPGDTSGSVAVEIPNKLWGLQGNLRHNWCRGCWWSVDLLAGVRYLEMEEGIGIREDVTLLRDGALPPFPAGTRAVVFDRFDTRNQFYGGQLGAQTELRRGPWFLDLRGTVALGNTRQVVNINGGQVFTTPTGAVSTFRGGLLALPTNIGHFTRDHFGVVPEVGVKLGYQVGPRLRLTVGYSFLYWSNVLRAADQIDRTLDVTQIPNFRTGDPPAGLARPIVPFRSTDFWAQGINFGVEFRY